MRNINEFLEDKINETALLEKLITFGNRAYPNFGNVVIMAGGGGCYPKGTEYFNGVEWFNIEDYDGGDIMVYDKSSNKSYIDKPLDYIVKTVDNFYRIKNKTVDFITSYNHNHLLLNKKTKKLEDLKTYELLNRCLDYEFITTDNPNDTNNKYSCDISQSTINKVDCGSKMYCFTTNTGYFLVRQNGRIFISGNSGKGFILNNLVGIEGKQFDVDALKELSQKSPKIVQKVKDEFGVDISELELKDPDNVSRLHEIIGGVLRIPKKKEQALLSNVLISHPDRKPNLIFDVTLKDLRKLETITRMVSDVGYDKKNIHIVWVINSFDTALKQNVGRKRVVPADILLNTHRGTSMTMKDIIDLGDGVKKYMNGDIWFVFNNKENRDVLLKKSKNDGSFVEDANMFKIKEQGKSIDKTKLTNEITNKIVDYVPSMNNWR